MLKIQKANLIFDYNILISIILGTSLRVRCISEGNLLLKILYSKNILLKETSCQKSRSLSNLVNIHKMEDDSEQNKMFGIPKNFRRKSLDLTKINIDSDEEKEKESTHYQQLMPEIKISQYNSTNGLNILLK